MKSAARTTASAVGNYRVFSLTWPAYMQIYRNKRKRLHKKRVQLPGDWFGTPTWPPFHCFGTPIWPPLRHVKTLYSMPFCHLRNKKETRPSSPSPRLLVLLIGTGEEIGEYSVETMQGAFRLQFSFCY